MADGHEEALHREFLARPVLLQHQTAEFFLAQQRRHPGVQHEADVLFFLQRLHQLLLAPEGGAAVDQPDLTAALAEQQRVLQGAVAAAADRHGLTLVEGPVADRAVAHAAAHQLLFSLDAQHPGLGAGGQDQRPRFKDRAGFAADSEALRAALDGGDLFQLRLGALLHGLLQQLIAQLHAADGHKAREVLHPGRPGDLPAEGVFLNDQHALARAPGVGGGGQPRGASADDDQIVHIHSPA